LEYYNPDSKEVTSREAMEFKNWQRTDEWDFNRVRPYYPTEFDHDFNFLKDRTYFLGLLVLGFSLLIVNKKY
jgi:hypothetical protein